MRRWPTLVLLLVGLFALAMAPFPSALSKGTDSDNRGRGPGDRDDDADDDNETKIDDNDDEGPSEKAGGRKPGHFALDDSRFDGRFVDFRFNETSCDITDYRLLDHAFFERIDLAAPCELDPKDEHGARVEVEGDESELKIHDNPTGLIRFEAEDDEGIHFQPAPGVLVTNQTSRSVDLATGNLSARLFLTGEGQLSRNGASGAITVQDGKGNFLAHPATEGDEDGADEPGEGKGEKPDKKIHKAMREGRMGGQVDVLIDNGTVKHEVLAFDDVVIKVSKKNDSAYRFLVDANLTEGKVFVVNFAPGAFQEGKVAVRYFDVDATGVADEVAITVSGNLSDAVDIQPGEGPEYWIVHDEEGKHVLVAVPSFSVHVFEVFSLAGAQLAPITVYGAVLGVLFVAAASVGMFAGRRR